MANRMTKILDFGFWILDWTKAAPEKVEGEDEERGESDGAEGETADEDWPERDGQAGHSQ